MPSGSVAGDVATCQTGATISGCEIGCAPLGTTTSHVTNGAGAGVTPVSTSDTSTGYTPGRLIAMRGVVLERASPSFTTTSPWNRSSEETGSLSTWSSGLPRSTFATAWSKPLRVVADSWTRIAIDALGFATSFASSMCSRMTKSPSGATHGSWNTRCIPADGLGAFGVAGAADAKTGGNKHAMIPAASATRAMRLTTRIPARKDRRGGA